ncbi:hypothetical protein [Phyllobacterium endophyticum]|uniref:hypothetical protein n=1 Tax=Phyllobacterium endophyticum TaxID=1149773 RepID=UPI000D0EC1A3|nr:hypothetical protein [Phyllobacterium endophyticum]MBB3234537.1 flagellar hook-associated protein FlgK [Phyllobacterium endophyticum]
MNTTRLREIVDFLISKEAEDQIQQLLTDLYNALTNLVSSPTDASFQQSYTSAMDSLSNALRRLEEDIQPAQKKQLQEINALKYFLIGPGKRN